MSEYNPAKWYWRVGNRAGVVFSAPASAYVAEDDAGFLAFLAAGNLATAIASDGDLADVLTKAGLPAAMIAAVDATDWSGISPAAHLAAAMAAGVQIASTGTPAIDATYHATGERWQIMLNQAQYVATFGAFSGGLDVLPWHAISGLVQFATTAQFLAIARAIGDWLTAWQLYVAGIVEEPPAGSVTIA
jgi:hypothetical protein